MSPAVSPTGETDDGALPPRTKPLGSRERRRIRTMREIQTEALRLFGARGYDNTTIEQIAAAADISPRTFFRYFPTKEDVVLWDEYDVVIEDSLARRPAGEPPGELMRAITREAIAWQYARDPDRLLARHHILFAVPAVRARFVEFARDGIERLIRGLPGERGEAEDLKIHLTALAILDAAGAALDTWQRSNGKEDLLILLDQAIDALIEGVAELRPAGPRRRSRAR
jgi:AcrR family transcriptional regulator